MSVFGQFGDNETSFNLPSGLAIFPWNNTAPDFELIAVADRRNHRIQFLNMDPGFGRCLMFGFCSLLCSFWYFEF